MVLPIRPAAPCRPKARSAKEPRSPFIAGRVRRRNRRQGIATANDTPQTSGIRSCWSSTTAPKSQQVTSSLFEHLGYDTVYRESADEAALKLLADGTKLDLVFSDIVMPGTIDGVGLASESARAIRICR